MYFLYVLNLKKNQKHMFFKASLLLYAHSFLYLAGTSACWAERYSSLCMAPSLNLLYHSWHVVSFSADLSPSGLDLLASGTPQCSPSTELRLGSEDRVRCGGPSGVTHPLISSPVTSRPLRLSSFGTWVFMTWHVV